MCLVFDLKQKLQIRPTRQAAKVIASRICVGESLPFKAPLLLRGEMPGHTVLYLLFAIRIIFAPFVDYHHSFFPDDKESTTHYSSQREELSKQQNFFYFCLHASMHFQTWQLPSSSILHHPEVQALSFPNHRYSSFLSTFFRFYK